MDQQFLLQLKRTYDINDSEASASRRAIASEQRMRSNDSSCEQVSSANEKQNKKLKLQKNSKSKTQKSIDGNYNILLAKLVRIHLICISFLALSHLICTFSFFLYSLAFLFVVEPLDGPNLSTNGRYDSSLGKVEVNKYLI